MGTDSDLDDYYMSGAMEYDKLRAEQVRTKKPKKKKGDKGEKSERETLSQTDQTGLSDEDQAVFVTPKPKPKKKKKTPESERDQIVAVQGHFIEVLSKCGQTLEDIQRHDLTESFQKMTNITLSLLENNAYLKGRIEELEKENREQKERTHELVKYQEAIGGARLQHPPGHVANQLSYAAMVTRSPNSQGTTELSQERDSNINQVPNMPQNAPPIEQREGLLIYSKQPTTNPAAKVTELLRANFSPVELGLGQPNIKPVRNGIIVLSHSAEGISKLKKAIEEHERTKNTLTTKEPTKRYPQFIISGLPSDTTEDEIVTDILRQTKEMSEQDCQVVFSFKEGQTNKAAVIEVSVPLYNELKMKKKIHVAWSVCSIREFIQVNKCNKCCEYGHSRKYCEGRERCMKCGTLSHTTRECEELTERCHACDSHNKRIGRTVLESSHSFNNPSCPTLQFHTRAAKSRIKYQ